MKIFILTTLLCFQFASAASPTSIRDLGNGAGGLKKKGHVSTFYSSEQALAKKTPLKLTEVPGLAFLVQQLDSLQIQLNFTTQFKAMALPTSTRKYYRVEEGEISAKEYKAMVQEYAKLMNLPPEHLTIFAFTNKQTGNTILMPEFFKLGKVTEQAAILFHESLWMAPQAWNLDYRKVVNAEKVAQAFFENPDSTDAVGDFYIEIADITQRSDLPMNAFFAMDLHQGFPWSAPQGSNRILLKNLFSDKILQCYFRDYADIIKNTPYPHAVSKDPQWVIDMACRDIIISEMLTLSAIYPQSLFVRGVLHYLVGTRSVIFVMTYDPKSADKTNYPAVSYASTLNDADYNDFINHLYMAPAISKYIVFPLQTEDGTYTGDVQF